MAVISDVHLASVQPFLALCEEQRVDRIVCLGDVERPDLLEGFLHCGVPLTYAVGNHEYDLIRLAAMDEWYDPRHRRARAFVESAGAVDKDEQAGLQVAFRFAGKHVLAVHTWPGDLENPWTCWRAKTIYRLWKIIEDPQDALCLLDYMRENDYWLVLRGHEHGRSIRQQARAGVRALHRWVPESGQSIELQHGTRYIITVGAYEHGELAILDETDGRVQISFVTIA